MEEWNVKSRTRGVRLKVCCISSVAEARLAVGLGASALGLVSEMPSGPGVISEALIAEIAATVPAGIGTFLLTSHDQPEAIIAQQRRCQVNTIQLCDRLGPGAHQKLRRALPGVAIVQVIHVSSGGALAEAQAVAPGVDAILLDSGNQSLAIKELGGTGRTHDWEISRRICTSIDRPIFLAGGLRPDNVAEAIESVRPYAVDVCSGVRTLGHLDKTKLSSFVAAGSAVVFSDPQEVCEVA